MWLQHLPKDKVPQCGPDLFFMLENFPLSQALQKLVMGSGGLTMGLGLVLRGAGLVFHLAALVVTYLARDNVGGTSEWAG